MVGNLDCFQLPLTKEGSDMLSQLVIQFTPIRALMKQWLKMPWSSCIEMFIILAFVPFPFIM